MAAEDFGLRIQPGWELSSVGRISPDGRFVVGTGVDPNGDRLGFVLELVVPACRNGIDDDGDGLVDAAEDPGCSGPTDGSEVVACSNGLDDDGDGHADYPADPGCDDPYDGNERSDALACDDGVDNDGDGWADYPFDPSCSAASGLTEAFLCEDGLDNDGDGHIDLRDPDCSSRLDDDEASAPFPAFEIDLLAAGDGLVTRDLEEGLDWLDVPHTAHLSYAEVLADAEGWVGDGWRHADPPELCRLVSRHVRDVRSACNWAGFVDVFAPVRDLLGTNDLPEFDGALTSGYLGGDSGPGHGYLFWQPQFIDAYGYSTAYEWPSPTDSPGHFLVREAPPACSNGVDDDGDGALDLADPGCRSASDESEETECQDGLDNDGDGRVDFPADPGCRFATSIREDPACDDRLDNDGDGWLDAPADPGCGGERWRVHEGGTSCGLGFELAPILVLVLGASRRAGRRQGEPSTPESE